MYRRSIKHEATHRIQVLLARYGDYFLDAPHLYFALGKIYDESGAPAHISAFSRTLAAL